MNSRMAKLLGAGVVIGTFALPLAACASQEGAAAGYTTVSSLHYVHNQAPSRYWDHTRRAWYYYPRHWTHPRAHYWRNDHHDWHRDHRGHDRHNSGRNDWRNDDHRGNDKHGRDRRGGH